ncbi:winged helix-turn-helix domain-containing protein [Novosphingobium pokkalii]|jgi:two-component system OmpR family response regulator|uniref:Winged helix-turn-helix domain-containing protein n=2 Tax=Novosphingobium pokkalii TaxID=1770194 RepID=A0ABV7V257_9SPHN|nr:response regulator transcription factor [Novosphingobium pokkalii]GHC82166.1 DNA-binding response regulator [Novosphingobium pokkalii]
MALAHSELRPNPTTNHPGALRFARNDAMIAAPANGYEQAPRRTHDARIAVLDEDQQTRDMLREYLEGQGMHVIAVANGTELRQLVAQEPIDAVILDVMARGEDSLGLLREMAEQPGTPPVMLLSAVASDIDRIVGLELGADDYLAKPFNPRELLARLRVVLRRGHAASARAAATPVLTFAGWVLDPTFYVVRDAAGRDVDLTSGEFKLLHALAAHAGQVVSREALLRLVHGDEAEAFDRAIDVAVSRLRAKLVRHGGGALIRTVRGEGYLFAARI